MARRWPDRAPAAFLALAWATLAAAAPLAAQGSDAAFAVSGIQRQFCISFLVGQAEASTALGSRFRPVIAAEAPNLVPAVRTLVEGEPEFAMWVPGQVCVTEAASVVRDTRRASEEGRTVAFGWAALLVRPADGPAGQAPVWRALEFFSPDGALRRSVRDALVNMEGADYEVGTAVGSTDAHLRIKTNGTTLVWEGREVGEPAPADPLTLAMAVDGRRNDLWTGSVNLVARGQRPLVGTLQVQGKSFLAEALKASPIRMVGPVQSGGGGTIQFSRR